MASVTINASTLNIPVVINSPSIESGVIHVPDPLEISVSLPSRKATFVSITPSMGSRIATNSSFEIKYFGAQLNTIQEHYITFEDVNGDPVKFDVSAVSFSSGISTFTVTPEDELDTNIYHELTLLTSITDVNNESIEEKSFKFMTKFVDETATIEENEVGQVNDVYYKKNKIYDLLDVRDIILNGDKFNFSFVPGEYDPETYTYSDATSSYLVHDLKTFLKERIKNQYFKGYESYFDNLSSFDVLSTSEFLDIEKALYPRSIDFATGSGLNRKIKFILELYAKVSGKHFVLVEPDPIEPFKYYIITDVPNSAWSGTIKPIVHPIGWQEKYVELVPYYVTYDKWSSTTTYSVGDRIQVEGEDNEFWVLECTVGGTTGSTTPEWSVLIVSSGTTITDGSVTWTVVEELYQVHTHQSEKYQLTEDDISEYRELLYIKGEGLAETVKWVETLTNLDLSNTGNLYLRSASSPLPARIVRSEGSWEIDNIIEGCDIYLNGTSGGTNDGTFTVDEVIDQIVSGSDYATSDETADWTLSSSDISLSFDTDHYEIGTESTNEIMYIDGLNFTSGQTYRIEATLRDGTAATGVEFQFYFNDGAIQTSTTKTTGNAWLQHETNIYNEFICATTTTSGKVGIKVLTNTTGLTFEMKNFVCTKMSQIELIDDEDLSAETITISSSEGQSYQIASMTLDYGFDASGLSVTTQYYFKVNGTEYDITTASSLTHDDIALLIDTELDPAGIGCVYDNLLYGYKVYSEDSSVTSISLTSGTSGTDLFGTCTNSDGYDTAVSYAGFDLNDRSDGIWIDGFIRPDPDTNEAVNDRTSDLYDFYALSPDYPYTVVPNWAHSVYEKFLDEPKWVPDTSYSVGDRIIVNGYILRCTTAGTSGTTEPLWPFGFTSGETVTDNTVIWTLSDLYNTDGWQANKLYYVGNQILVRGYLVEVKTAGTSGTTEPTWPSTFTYNEEVTDNTVIWKVIEEIETTRRDLLNVRNSIMTLPKFPLNYLEALPTAGITDVSAIIYDSFERDDLAYKALGSMTEQYDGDPYAIIGREEFAHVTELKLVRGSSVTSFSNPGEDITFLYTNEDNPVVWIQSDTFTTNEFSFGNTDLANVTDIETEVVDGTDLAISTLTAGYEYPTGSGNYVQRIEWNSSSVSYSDVSNIETGDILDLQADVNPIDAINQGDRVVYRHDHYNLELLITATALHTADSDIKANSHTEPTDYYMTSFLIPGTFSFDEALLEGYNKLVFRGRIDPLDYKSTNRFQYHYWVYDSNITYPDDDGSATETTFEGFLEEVENFTTITKDTLDDGTNIVFESHRFNLNSLIDEWTKGDLIFEYTDSGGGVPSTYTGTYFAKVEDVLNTYDLIESDNAIDDDSGDWTIGASVTINHNSSKYYELESSATDQKVYLDTSLSQNKIYQIQVEMAASAASTLTVNLTWYDGSSYTEGSDITLPSSFTNYTLTFEQTAATTASGRVGIRVRTDTSVSGEEVYFKTFTLHEITDNLIVFSYAKGISPAFNTSNYYSTRYKLPYDTVLTNDDTYTIIGTTSNLNPITTYDRKVDVLFNKPDLFDYDWTVTPSTGTALSDYDDNLLTFFVENSATTCSVDLDVNCLNWRTDKVLDETGILTFDSEFNTLTRGTGDWTADTTPLAVGDVLYIKGTSFNDGYYIVDTITSNILTVTNDNTFSDETLTTGLPENTEVSDEVIQGWTMLYHTISPSTLTSL